MFIFDIEFKAAEQIVEVILAILLFTDATEVPGGVLGREPRLTLRLLRSPSRSRSSRRGWSASFSCTA